MKRIITSALLLSPVMAFAQGDLVNSELGTFILSIQEFINNMLIPLVFSVALLVFLYGTYKYFIAGSGNESAREDGKKFMLYAVIGFVLMVSIWGIVGMLAGIIPDSGPIDYPQA